MKTIQPFASYKYDTDDVHPFFKNDLNTLLAYVLLVLIAIPFLFVHIIFSGIILVVGLILLGYIKNSINKIHLYDGYIIIGSKIIFYLNISKINVNGRDGNTILTFKDAEADFILLRSNFPTNARKQDKIKAQLDNKFFKINEKIIKRTKKINPNVRIEITHYENLKEKIEL